MYFVFLKISMETAQFIYIIIYILFIYNCPEYPMFGEFVNSVINLGGKASPLCPEKLHLGCSVTSDYGDWKEYFLFPHLHPFLSPLASG